MRHRRALLLGLLLGTLTLTSCAHPSGPVDTSPFDLIRIGMSDAEVIQCVGPPGMVSEQPRTLVQVPTPSGIAFREKRRYTYYYPGPVQGRALQITFEDGVVVDKRQGARWAPAPLHVPLHPLPCCLHRGDCASFCCIPHAPLHEQVLAFRYPACCASASHAPASTSGSCPIIPVKAIGREALLRESNHVCEHANPTVAKEHAHMPQRLAPRRMKAQELAALLQGHTPATHGEEWLSTWVQLATERVLQEAWEREQAEVLGRGRYERHPVAHGSRNGYEDGTRKTAEGVLRVNRPQVRGLEDT